MKTYKFPSKSNPEAEPHTALVSDTGRIICSCPGFEYRRTCTHVKQIQAGTAIEDMGECVETEDGDATFDFM